MTAITAWPTQAENWLDARGKMAWIGAMILGFIFFWPVGLALLFYMIFFKRTFSGCSRRASGVRFAMGSTGNSAFDAYKAETLQRLEEEQSAFDDFLKRLREAKDKVEFDQFMDERARAAKPAAGDAS
jgi:hypothetical protein